MTTEESQSVTRNAEMEQRIILVASEMYRVIREQYDDLIANPPALDEWCDFYTDVVSIVTDVEPHLFYVAPDVVAPDRIDGPDLRF